MNNIYYEYGAGVVVNVWQFQLQDNTRYIMMARSGIMQGDRLLHEELLEEGTQKAQAIRKGISFFDKLVEESKEQ